MPIRVIPNPNGWGPLFLRGYVYVWRDGRKRRISVPRQSAGTTDRGEAEAVARQIEARYVRETIEGRAPCVTFAEKMTEYLDGGGEARFLDKPLALLGAMEIDQIGQAELDAAAMKAYPSATSGTRRRQFYTPVMAVLNHGRTVKRPEDKGERTVWITPTQAALVIQHASKDAHANPWAGPLVELFYGGGLRLSEGLKLDGATDVFPGYGYVIVRDPKNGYERVVRLPRRTLAALAGLPTLGQPGPIFRRQDGEPYAVIQASGTRLKFFETAVAAAGLDPKVYTPHTARHSWATWFYAVTKDQVALKANGGWRSNQWQRYTHLASSGLAEEAISLGWDFRDQHPVSQETAGSVA